MVRTEKHRLDMRRADTRPRQLAGALALHVLLSLSVAASARASALLTMSSGAADMGLNGTTIAEALAPSGALFHNPAGLCEFDGKTLSASLGLGFGALKISNDDGYSQDNDLFALFPDGAFAMQTSERLRFGVGMYGSVGTNYDFEADPAAGVDNDFHAETSIAELPLAVAYKVSDQLYVGAELIALFGYLRNRYTLADQLFKYTLRGPGVQGMFGVTWKPHELWSLGVGVKTPGRIWMPGSTAVPAGIRRDVDLEVQVPLQVSLGVTHHAAERLTLHASGR